MQRLYVPLLPGVLPCSEAGCADAGSGLSKCGCFRVLDHRGIARHHGASQRDPKKKGCDEDDFKTLAVFSWS